MRSVIDNETLTSLDKMPDDLTNAYWNRVDFSGRALPFMEDADLFDFDGKGAVFPENGTALVQMRITDPKDRLLALDGATLDSQSSSYNHHFVAEGMRQSENSDDPINIFVRDYCLADYSHSWFGGLYEAMKLFSKKAVYDALRIAFAGYQKWLNRLEFHFEHESWGPEVPWATDLSAVKLMGKKDEHQFDLRFLATGNDRFLMARGMEDAVVLSPTNDISKLKVWVAQSNPPVVFTADHRKWREMAVPDLPEGVRNG